MHSDIVRSFNADNTVAGIRADDAAARLFQLAGARPTTVKEPAEWVYPVNDRHAASWGYPMNVDKFFQQRIEPVSQWFLSNGFRQMRPGDLLWIYATAPRQHIMAAGIADDDPYQADDDAWWVGMKWDFELTDALLDRPAEILDSAPRTARKLSPVEAGRLADWLASAPRAGGAVGERGRRRVLAEIVVRQGQPVFRQRLVAAYEGRCAISGCDVEVALQAAHIDPYDGPASNAVRNGLLLRADLHNLFDTGLLWIDRHLRVRVAEELRSSHYGELHGQTLRWPRRLSEHPDAEALRRHRSRNGRSASGRRIPPSRATASG